jgi:hypothetical protein
MAVVAAVLTHLDLLMLVLLLAQTALHMGQVAVVVQVDLEAMLITHIMQVVATDTTVL